MTKAYETTPGTMPHRAVEFLRKSGATCLGREVSTAVICDYLETDLTTFAKSMGPAKEHGVVRARRIAGKGVTYWWCLGKGESDLPEDHVPDAPMREHRLPSGIGKPGPLFPGVNAGTAAQHDVTPLEIPVFRAALRSDDTMVLEGVQVQPDGTVLLDAARLAAVKRLVGAPA